MLRSGKMILRRAGEADFGCGGAFACGGRLLRWRFLRSAFFRWRAIRIAQVGDILVQPHRLQRRLPQHARVADAADEHLDHEHRLEPHRALEIGVERAGTCTVGFDDPRLPMCFDQLRRSARRRSPSRRGPAYSQPCSSSGRASSSEPKPVRDALGRRCSRRPRTRPTPGAWSCASRRRGRRGRAGRRAWK